MGWRGDGAAARGPSSPTGRGPTGTCARSKRTAGRLTFLNIAACVLRLLRHAPPSGHKKGRVIGVLLGEVRQGRVDCTNCFALPFAEQSEGVFFVDADYLATMYRMFYKVNAKEKVSLGFCHTMSCFSRPLFLTSVAAAIAPSPLRGLDCRFLHDWQRHSRERHPSGGTLSPALWRNACDGNHRCGSTR